MPLFILRLPLAYKSDKPELSVLWLPLGHYSKLIGSSSPVDLRGHPIVCYNGELCASVLRILRAASTHFPVLRKLLAHVTTALNAHRSVCDIDNAWKMITTEA